MSALATWGVYSSWYPFLRWCSCRGKDKDKDPAHRTRVGFPSCAQQGCMHRPGVTDRLNTVTTRHQSTVSRTSAQCQNNLRTMSAQRKVSLQLLKRVLVTRWKRILSRHHQQHLRGDACWDHHQGCTQCPQQPAGSFTGALFSV